MQGWQAYIGELILGTFLGILGFAFRALNQAFQKWGDVVDKRSRDILAKISALQAEFHEHKVKNENRLTRIETQQRMKEGNKRVD